MPISPVLRQEIEGTFEIIKTRSTHLEIVFLCPQPGCGDKTGNRSVNIRSGKTNCWRCNVAGDFVSWANKLGFHFSSSSGEAGMGVSLADMLPDLNASTKLFLPPVRPLALPKGFTPLTKEPKSCYTRFIGDMARRKNLDLRTFRDAGAGFTREDPEWEPFCIFPVREYNTVVYYQGRTYSEEPGEKTKRFPGRDKVPYGSRYWLYNIDELRDTKARCAIVVESILNVLSLRNKIENIGVNGIVPVAAFKHSMSKEQIAKLLRCPDLEEICLLYDHDAIAASWKSGPRISRMRVSVAEMPAGEDNSRMDPNDDVEAAWQAFEERKAISMNSSSVEAIEKLGLNLGGRDVRVLYRK